RSRRSQGFGGLSCMFFVNLICRADAGKLGFAVEIGLAKLALVRKSIVRDGFYASGFEEILGEGGACREGRDRSEIGEEDPRPRAGLCEIGIRAIAQALERLCRPDGGQGGDGDRPLPLV